MENRRSSNDDGNKSIASGSCLAQRQIRNRNLHNLSSFIKHRLNETYHGLISNITELRESINKEDIQEINLAINDCFVHMFDDLTPEAVSLPTKPAKQQECEAFIALGGVDMLLELFEKPFAQAKTPQWSQQLIELWNTVMLLLRELCYTIPSLANNIFGLQHIVFVFTALRQPAMFDAAVNLLEEILSARIDTFSLDLVPDLYSLLDILSVRSVAHFCRILSLVLFESEDRQLMEGAQVLRSLDLLQLRRDRMSRPFAFSIVERNQSLILGSPNLVNRLLLILRVAQYGPNLADSIRHNVVTQHLSPMLMSAMEAVLQIHAQGQRRSSVWVQLAELESMALKSEPASSSSASYHKGDKVSNVSTAPSFTSSSTTNESMSDNLDLVATMVPDEALQSFPLQYDDSLLNPNSHGMSSSASGTSSSGPGSDEEQAIGTGLTERQVMARLLQAFSSNDEQTTGSQIFSLMGSLQFWRPQLSPQIARFKLQFVAVLLVPHQVEILFVLCALLSGRRKLYVQDRLATLGLGKLLTQMFDQMSWDSPPFTGPNPLEHIHGPGCECNPESALRVQYLRLVHNFYDRDFLGNRNKHSLLSSHEQVYIRESLTSWSGELVVPTSEQGLISKVATLMKKESFNSIYRFWLSSCLEAFVRGTNNHVQLFIVRQDVLRNIINESSSSASRGLQKVEAAPGNLVGSNLQTSLDLLGELVKDNECALALLESCLATDDAKADVLVGDGNSEDVTKTLNAVTFSKFMSRMLLNIVDSNVFLRSIYLTFYTLNMKYLAGSGETNLQDPVDALLDSTENCVNSKTHTNGYLTHTWIQFKPLPLSSFIPVMPASMNKSKESVSNLGSDTGGEGLSMVSSSDIFKGNSPRALSKYDPPSPSPILFSARGYGTTYTSLNSETGAVRRHPTPATTLSDTTSVIIGRVSDAFTGLQNAAIQFGHSFASIDRHVRTEKRDAQLTDQGTSSRSFKVGRPDDDELEFVTPPEYPRYAKVIPQESDLTSPVAVHTTIWMGAPTGLPARSPKSGNQSLGTFLDTIPEPGPSSTTSPIPTDDGPLHPSTSASTDSTRLYKWSLPPSLSRIHKYMMRNEHVVLLQLITAVTVRTITHENISCINTALLILLLADLRGELVYLMTDLRKLAALGPLVLKQALDGDLSASALIDQARHSNDSLMTDEGINAGVDAETDMHYDPMLAEWQANTLGERVSESVGTCACARCSPSLSLSPSAVATNVSICHVLRQPKHTKIDSTGSSRHYLRHVMQNLREVLWFWREYYLRRGRDRLSLEFSVHLPFTMWERLVERLCADDGSEVALLSKSISLPLSPYFTPSHAYAYQPNEVVNY